MLASANRPCVSRYERTTFCTYILTTFFSLPSFNNGRKALVTICAPVTFVCSTSPRSVMAWTPSGAKAMMPALLISTSKPLPCRVLSTCLTALLMSDWLVVSSLMKTTLPQQLSTRLCRAGVSLRAVAKMVPTLDGARDASCVANARPRPREQPVTK
jgi:hypothetical protein